MQAIETDVEQARSTVYVGLYAASFKLAHTSPNYREMLAQTCNYPDGAGVVWALRRRGVSAIRTATTDIIDDLLLLASNRGWRVVLYGGESDVVHRVAQSVRQRFPGVAIAGVYDGYSRLDPVEIASLQPNLTLIARGAGVQEAWALAAREAFSRTKAGPLLTCGGLFDFIAGRRRRAPIWMQKWGLEWVFRTALEPRRLMKRYLLGNSWFIVRYILGTGTIPVGLFAQAAEPAGDEQSIL